MLKEYLYIDTLRLNRYVTQFMGSSLKAEKGRKVGAEFDLAGPKVTFEQETQQREMSDFEKIDALEKHLEKSGMIANSRPTKRHTPISFVREHFDAYRVRVPKRRPEGDDLPAFSFWISPSDDYRGMLILLEHCLDDDGEPIDYSTLSTYTVLQSLVYFSRKQLRASVLHWFPEAPHPNPYAKIDDSHPPSLHHEYHNVKAHMEEFVTDPVTFLRESGCILNRFARLRSLYRVREYGPEAVYSLQKITTFGYPIYIHEALQPQ